MIYQHKIRKVPVYAKLDVFPTAEEAQREQQIVMERNSKKLFFVITLLITHESTSVLMPYGCFVIETISTEN